MTIFREFIDNYNKLSESDWKIISGLFIKQRVKKNEEIVIEGKICRYSFFIEEGLFRNYIINEGNDITKFFIPAPFFITSRNSFINQAPAAESIQAIENSVVWQITLKQSNELMKLDSWKTFIQKFLIDVNSRIENQLIKSKTETAEVRYKKLLNDNPKLINRVPLKYLATYLGIAPQSLSRIRKNHFNK